MKKLLILGVIALFTACSGGENKTVETEPVTEKVATKDELQLEITKMEQELTNKMRTKFDDELAKRVVTFYRDYAQNNPKDSITPEYLFKAGYIRKCNCPCHSKTGLIMHFIPCCDDGYEIVNYHFFNNRFIKKNDN